MAGRAQGGGHRPAAIGTLYVAITFVQVWHASRQDHGQPAEAIVVMGAAQYDGRPSPVFQAAPRSCLRALPARAWRRCVITTGSKQEGDRFTEGFAGYQYLSSLGVPDANIAIVDTGTNTWEELEAAAAELQRAKRQSAARGARPRVLIVSDAYHSLRLEHTAREVGLDPLVAPTGSGRVDAATGARNGGGVARSCARLPQVGRTDVLSRARLAGTVEHGT